MIVAAGHGLTVANVRAVAAIPEIEELNIGYSIVSRALTIGMAKAVREMRETISVRPDVDKGNPKSQIPMNSQLPNPNGIAPSRPPRGAAGILAVC